jgi:hypothetical protein
MTAGDVIDAVTTLRSSLKKASSRGLTVSIENEHPSLELLHMQYYIVGGNCFDAPKVNILPDKFGVGAFSATFSSRGTAGYLVYRIAGLSGKKLSKQIYLAVGWEVPLVGANRSFLEILHVEHAEYPNVLGERRRVFKKLARRRMVAAGQTIQRHIRIDEETCFTVSSSMATSSIANLKVELTPLKYLGDASSTEDGLDNVIFVKPKSGGVIMKLIQETASTVETVREHGKTLLARARSTFYGLSDDKLETATVLSSASESETDEYEFGVQEGSTHATLALAQETQAVR